MRRGDGGGGDGGAARVSAAQVDGRIRYPDINDDNNNDGKTTWFYWVWRCQELLFFPLACCRRCSAVFDVNGCLPGAATKLNCKCCAAICIGECHILMYTHAVFFGVCLCRNFQVEMKIENEKQQKKKHTKQNKRKLKRCGRWRRCCAHLSYKLNLNWHKTH